MVGNSQKMAAWADWDTTQLLDVVHHSRGPEQTLYVLKSFISNKNFVETALKLEKEDVVGLVNVIDQVRTVFVFYLERCPLDDDLDD